MKNKNYYIVRVNEKIEMKSENYSLFHGRMNWLLTSLFITGNEVAPQRLSTLDNVSLFSSEIDYSQKAWR